MYLQISYVAEVERGLYREVFNKEEILWKLMWSDSTHFDETVLLLPKKRLFLC